MNNADCLQNVTENEEHSVQLVHYNHFSHQNLTKAWVIFPYYIINPILCPRVVAFYEKREEGGGRNMGII